MRPRRRAYVPRVWMDLGLWMNQIRWTQPCAASTENPSRSSCSVTTWVIVGASTSDPFSAYLDSSARTASGMLRSCQTVDIWRIVSTT